MQAGQNWVPSCLQAVSKPVWHMLLLCVQWETTDDGYRNCPKHVEFHSKNKFEKLVHPVGFIITSADGIISSLHNTISWLVWKCDGYQFIYVFKHNHWAVLCLLCQFLLWCFISSNIQKNKNNEIFTWGQGKVSAHHFPCFSKLFHLRHLLEKFYEFYISVIVIRILFNLRTEHISRTLLVKETVHQRTGHEGPAGKQRYSSTISLTSELDGGQWSTPHPSCFTFRKEIPYPFWRSLGGAQGQSWQVQKILPPLGFNSQTVQPIASHYIDYTIPAHSSSSSSINYFFKLIT